MMPIVHALLQFAIGMCVCGNVRAGTHPKLLQERAGHTDIKLTMDIYGKIAGQMALTEEQEARLDALAARALPAALPGEPRTNSADETANDGDRKPTKDSDPDSAS